jgi:hypothetical protein
MFMLVVGMVMLTAVIDRRYSEAQSRDFKSDWEKTWSDFGQGAVSNFLVVGGANYNTKAHGWGGEGLLGYNLPKFEVPLEPYLIPLVGLTYLGNSWEGFSGTVSLNKDIYLLRLFDGGQTNGFLHEAKVSVNGLGGVGTDLSGSQFGSFTVPGKKPENGQGTAAVTGVGLSASVFHTPRLGLGLWFEKVNWTTIEGDILCGGVTLKYSPKGW